MFNVHTHIFTVKDVPVDFLKDAGVNQKIGRILVRSLQKNGISNWIANFLAGKSSAGEKYRAFIKIGSQKSMTQVFESVRDGNGYPSGTKFVALPMQLEHMGAGACEYHNYADQIEELVQTKVRYSSEIVPFYAIDPRMGNTPEDVLNFVKSHIQMAVSVGKSATGTDIFSRVFYGIKLYPSLGYFPYSPKLQLVYKFAQDNNLPIMTHASRGGVYYLGKIEELEELHAPVSFNAVQPRLLNYNSTNKAQPIYQEPKYDYPEAKNAKAELKNICDYFLDPENYVDALDMYPNLKICFAHFGSDSEIVTKLHLTNYSGGEDGNEPDPIGPRNDTWYDKILSLLNNPNLPNLFTDISYTLHMPEFRELVKLEIENDLAANPGNDLTGRLITKIMYGTDFFMTTREKEGSEKELLTNATKSFTTIDPQKYPKIAALGPGKLWEYLTITNPKRYLSSNIATF